MLYNVTLGKLQSLRDLRQSQMKSHLSRQLHHDRSPRRPQVPSKMPPLPLQNAFDVLLPPFVRTFLFLLLLYILLVLPSAGRHFSFIDRNISPFLFPLRRRPTKALKSPLVSIYIRFGVDYLLRFLQSQVSSRTPVTLTCAPLR